MLYLDLSVHDSEIYVRQIATLFILEIITNFFEKLNF